MKIGTIIIHDIIYYLLIYNLLYFYLESEIPKSIWLAILKMYYFIGAVHP